MIKDWISVGRLSDIPRRGARRVVAGVTSIAIFRTDDDRVFALEDKCPHKNGPLSQGIVHGDCVTCPLHNWVIALDTGEACGADEGKVASFPVRVDDLEIFISVPLFDAVKGH
mgnify:FL=1|tara:strand:+ start:34851 stop:35189 length:339 start_codon:yes stop_codon:yes gene_type:complete